MQDKKLLIITGPQGSGNHLFSRLLSLHPKVSGWKDLLKQYWVPSDEEPFAEFWINPSALTEDYFNSHQYYLANVSCPFFFDGVMQVPKILEVAKQAKDFGITVSIAIIVRDQNINAAQQQRLLNFTTISVAQEYYYTALLSSDFPVHFLDYEAFFLHKQHYLKWASKILDFPIAYDDPNIMNFISVDSNYKYIKPVKKYWLDEEIKKGRNPKNDKSRS